MLTQSKAFAEENFDCRVRSVVTDNAPAMAKMREGLDRDDQDLITYGCLAHWLNLVGKDGLRRLIGIFATSTFLGHY